MSKYTVVVFPDESKAYEGKKALLSLHNEDSLTLYGVAVIAKDADGVVSVKEERDKGPTGWALGMLTGGMIGALAGPAGVAAGVAMEAAAAGAVVGIASGGALGALFDLNDLGVGIEFVNEVGERMTPGTAAVVAEIEEYWTSPLDTRMSALDGEVFRRWRIDVEDDQFYRDLSAWNAELDELDEELKAASDENKAKLQTKKDALQQKVTHAKEKARKRADELDSEVKGKIQRLKEQSASAKAEAKTKILKAIDDLEAKHDARLAKFKSAIA